MCFTVGKIKQFTGHEIIRQVGHVWDINKSGRTLIKYEDKRKILLTVEENSQYTLKVNYQLYKRFMRYLKMILVFEINFAYKCNNYAVMTVAI